MKRLSVLALVPLVALLSGALSTPSGATSVPPKPPSTFDSTGDARGDAMAFSMGELGETAPARRNGDLVGMRLNHTKGTVRVFLRFAELRRTGEQHGYLVRLRTPKLERYVRIGAWPGKRGPIDRAAYWSGSSPTMSGPHGNPRRCGGMKRTINYNANTVLLVVPRTCLGNPKEVYAGARFTLVTNYQTGYVDDAGYSNSELDYPPATVLHAYHPGDLP